MTDFICIDVFPMLGEQVRCGGETLALLTNVARVPTPRRRNHMWVESVVGSLPCYERFFSAYSGFSLSSKTKRLLKIPIPIPTKNQFECYLFLFISQFPGI